MAQFTIGCDPEIFIEDADGNPVNPEGIIPGTKEEPVKVALGAVQVDGLAAEFNTDPLKVTNKTLFSDRVSLQIRTLQAFLPKGYKIVIKPVQEFSQEFLDAQSGKAKELGCDPDFNAYTMKENPRPDGETATFRTGAGHIHIGWGDDIPVDNPEHFKICADFVKVLDATVGLYMTVLEKPNKRAELYGKAGAFRPKPYGVEYRTPSNVWIASAERRKTIVNLVNNAIRYHSGGQFEYYLEQKGTSFEGIRDIIDTKDVTKAKDILRNYFTSSNFKIYSESLKSLKGE